MCHLLITKNAYIFCGLHELRVPVRLVETLWWCVYGYLSKMTEKTQGILKGMKEWSRCRPGVGMMLVTTAILSAWLLSWFRRYPLFLFDFNYTWYLFGFIKKFRFLKFNGYLKWRYELIVEKYIILYRDVSWYVWTVVAIVCLNTILTNGGLSSQEFTIWCYVVRYLLNLVGNGSVTAWKSAAQSYTFRAVHIYPENTLNSYSKLKRVGILFLDGCSDQWTAEVLLKGHFHSQRIMTFRRQSLPRYHIEGISQSIHIHPSVTQLQRRSTGLQSI